MILVGEHIGPVLYESSLSLLGRQTAVAGFQPIQDVLKRQLADVVIFECASISHLYILVNYGEYRRPLKSFAQRGRSERRAESYPLGYVEGLIDARTKLGELFSGLLKSGTGASYDQYRTGGMSQQTFGHTAEIESLALGQITRADHQQLVMARLDMLHDRVDQVVHVDLSDS